MEKHFTEKEENLDDWKVSKANSITQAVLGDFLIISDHTDQDHILIKFNITEKNYANSWDCIYLCYNNLMSSKDWVYVANSWDWIYFMTISWIFFIPKIIF